MIAPQLIERCPLVSVTKPRARPTPRSKRVNAVPQRKLNGFLSLVGLDAVCRVSFTAPIHDQSAHSNQLEQQNRPSKIDSTTRVYQNR